jgi:hypothetical protein
LPSGGLRGLSGLFAALLVRLYAVQYGALPT